MTPRPSARREARLGGFARDRGGVSGVEFALVLPVMLLLVFGGYQVTEAAGAYRKTTLTARTVADLATQYTTMGTSDVATVLNASAQVMAPFNTAALTIVLTQFQVSSTGAATVIWSKALNGTALTQGAAATLPANICLPGASIVLAQVSYLFTPAVVYRRTGAFNLSSSIYMSPRSVQSIPYTGT